MNFLYFSKRILFAVMAVSFALFIGFHLLQARSNEELEQSLDEMATLAVESQDYAQAGVPDLEDEERAAALIWLSSPLARALFREPHQGGDVFVYLSMGRLYGVDEGGHVVEVPDDEAVKVGSAVHDQQHGFLVAGQRLVHQLVQRVTVLVTLSEGTDLIVVDVHVQSPLR